MDTNVKGWEQIKHSGHAPKSEASQMIEAIWHKRDEYIEKMYPHGAIIPVPGYWSLVIEGERLAIWAERSDLDACTCNKTSGETSGMCYTCRKLANIKQYLTGEQNEEIPYE